MVGPEGRGGDDVVCGAGSRAVAGDCAATSALRGAVCSTAHASLWVEISSCTAQQSAEQNCTGARTLLHEATLHIEYFAP